MDIVILGAIIRVYSGKLVFQKAGSIVFRTSTILALSYIVVMINAHAQPFETKVVEPAER